MSELHYHGIAVCPRCRTSQVLLDDGDGPRCGNRLACAERRAETVEVDAAALREALDEAVNLCHTPERHQDAHWYQRLEAVQAVLKQPHPGAALLSERQHLLCIALAAWKLSEEISEFEGPVSSETVDALDKALCDAYGDTITNWYAVRDKIVAQIEPKASTGDGQES